MTNSFLVVALTIAGMTLATYFTRFSGLFLASRLNFGPRGEAFLKAIPGGILVSLVAPTVLTSSPAEAGAAVATLIAARKTGNLAVAMAAGVGTVWMLRQALG